MLKQRSAPERHRSVIAGPDIREALPDAVEGWAVFLDVDGTLLDIAATPDAVVAPARLGDDLRKLAAKAHGALALVTGRAIGFLDGILATEGLCVAGLHGAEWRDASGRTGYPEARPGFDRAKMRLKLMAAQWPGVLIEDKGAAVAAHFRQAPRFEPELRLVLEAALAEAGAGWTLQEGKCVLEIRPAGRDKGDAVRQFMANAPFRGRRPLAVGDDVTDEAMFRAVNELGGRSVRVGRDMRPSAARAAIGSPAEVRAWIGRVAA